MTPVTTACPEAGKKKCAKKKKKKKRGSIFRLNFFSERRGSLTKNRRKNAFFFARFSFYVPRPWDFSSGTSIVAILFFLQIVFWERS